MIFQMFLRHTVENLSSREIETHLSALASILPPSSRTNAMNSSFASSAANSAAVLGLVMEVEEANRGKNTDSNDMMDEQAIFESSSSLEDEVVDEGRLSPVAIEGTIAVKYSELRLMCIARAASLSASNGSPPPTKTIGFPTVPRCDRRCLICNHMGHFEIECKNAGGADLAATGRSLQLEKKIDDAVSRPMLLSLDATIR